MFPKDISDSLIHFRKVMNDTNINCIKLSVFAKCAEKKVDIDTQQLRVSGWG